MITPSAHLNLLVRLWVAAAALAPHAVSAQADAASVSPEACTGVEIDVELACYNAAFNRDGFGPAQIAGALSAALPMLLRQNAQRPQGAQWLFGALPKDHRGLDLGSVLGAVLGTGATTQPATTSQNDKILGHVFGDRQPRAALGGRR